MSPFRRRQNTHPLVVGMAGVKMGDRFVQIGCADGGPLAALAGQVGLSGRAAAAVPDEASAGRARKAAVRAGILLEVEIAPPSHLPFEDAAFDVVVIDNTAGLMSMMQPDERGALVHEAARILAPGGRVMVVSRGARSGLRALLSRASIRPRTGPPFDPRPSLQADGFKAVRLLAEREGLVFVEGVKHRV